MIDMRYTDFKNTYWKLLEVPESQHISNTISNIFYTSRHIFSAMTEKTLHIQRIDIPDDVEIIKNIDNSHELTANKINLRTIYDLTNLNSWEMLWTHYVDVFTYYDKILYTLSANELYPILNWYINKMKEILKNEFSIDDIMIPILEGAISYNNTHVLLYVIKELSSDLSKYGTEKNSIIAVARLAARPNTKQDYCYHTMKLLIDHNFFANSPNINITLGTNAVMFHAMGHVDTYNMIQKYINNMH